MLCDTDSSLWNISHIQYGQPHNIVMDLNNVLDLLGSRILIFSEYMKDEKIF